MDYQYESCPICRNLLEDVCLECTENNKTENCRVVIGKCGHPFHEHCMNQWLVSRSFCPLCNENWEEGLMPRAYQEYMRILDSILRLKPYLKVIIFPKITSFKREFVNQTIEALIKRCCILMHDLFAN
ncbi:ring-box protein 1a-related [Anaeramoeba ignava]|uniref:Ring-box protein 1a-related n=1 Tax=Anaeramoeba ignava TaxID=1746090 RepID=A0A9Q0RAT1_ANAIG|nr:ring-box protein 1a-related [Anaeramoeba ignava]